MSSVRLLSYGLLACPCAKVLCHLPVFGINALMAKIVSIRMGVIRLRSNDFTDDNRRKSYQWYTTIHVSILFCTNYQPFLFPFIQHGNDLSYAY